MSTHAAKRVLVAGGGVAGLEALLALRALAGTRVDLSLLAPTDEFVYWPPAVGEPFGRGRAAHYSLADLAGAIGARLVGGSLTAVDASWRVAVTADGTSLAYDMLLVAVGTTPVPALQGALTWTPQSDPSRLGGLLRDIEEGYSKRIAFVAPPGVGWTLPLYELALMTAARAWDMGQDDVQITIYTPEPAPLALLGARTSAAVARELARAGVAIRTGVCVLDDVLRPGRLRVRRRNGVRTDQPLKAERVVALPRRRAPYIVGLPRDDEGFLPVDRHCLVHGSGSVWAAGDVTDHPVKQGGLATAQADAAAEAIAAAAGADLQPRPFDPVLRGVLMTGRGTHFMSRGADAQVDEIGSAQRALWRPPAKVVSRYLSPFLAELPDRRRAESLRPLGLPFNIDSGARVVAGAVTGERPARELLGTLP